MDEGSVAERAIKDANSKLAFLDGLHGNGNPTLEKTSARGDVMGDNALRHVLGEFGSFDKGWLADVDFNQDSRDTLLAHCYQETVASYTVALSAWHEAHKARRMTILVAVLALVSLTMNAGAILVLR